MVQRIPMILVAPNLKERSIDSEAWARLVDVNPMVRAVMALPHHKGLDGSAAPIRPHLAP